MGTQALQDRIHEERKNVDAVIKTVGLLKLAPNSEQQFLGQVTIQRELALAFTKLQEAKMWLGKCLEVVGSELPEQYRDEAKS